MVADPLQVTAQANGGEYVAATLTHVGCVDGDRHVAATIGRREANPGERLLVLLSHDVVLDQRVVGPGDHLGSHCWIRFGRDRWLACHLDAFNAASPQLSKQLSPDVVDVPCDPAGTPGSRCVDGPEFALKSGDFPLGAR